MKGEDYIRDVDYSDVFRGPPRQLWRRGKRVAEEEEEEETKDKPIFGGKSMVLRRHLHGDHFFDDIFRGDCSTWSWRTHPHHRSRSSNETNGGADEIKYEVHQSNRYHSTNVREDFAKIFSKETDSTLKTDVKKRSQSCRWMSDQKVIENLRKVELEQCFQFQTKTPSYAKFMRWDSKILDNSIEDLFELRELSDDLEKDAPHTEAYEETKALDAKIRQWSLGKKGNLRSLLSTLQYVLWEGSEWKAIALVDLVEENQVKRAYQKALLRLHPDKLQQRSVASHHKCIALKVFEILQEEWDHFNNIAPL